MDRNQRQAVVAAKAIPSLSARRAWIEIPFRSAQGRGRWSLSARRAWIEIIDYLLGKSNVRMSLSARRAWIEISFDWGMFPRTIRRSPQGERG